MFIIDKSNVPFVNNESLARGDLVDQILPHCGEVMCAALVRPLGMNASTCPQVHNNLMVSTSAINLLGIIFGISSLVGVARLVCCCDGAVKTPNEGIVEVVGPHHLEAQKRSNSTCKPPSQDTTQCFVKASKV